MPAKELDRLKSKIKELEDELKKKREKE